MWTLPDPSDRNPALSPHQSAMKTILLSLAILTGLAIPASADNILIYKIVETTKDTFYNVDDPGTANAVGTGPFNSTFSQTSYIAIDLDAPTSFSINGETVRVFLWINGQASPALDKDGNPINSKKFMFVNDPTSPDPLVNDLDRFQTLKAPNTFLWNHQSGFEGGNDFDSDDDMAPDNFNQFFGASQGKGTGFPLVINSMLTIPNVARTFIEKTVNTYSGDDVLGDPGNYPPFRYWGRALITTTWTLDTTLTKLANTVDIEGTDDINLAGTQPAGSLTNAVQRIHNLLYSQGYRVEDESSL